MMIQLVIGRVYGIPFSDNNCHGRFFITVTAIRRASFPGLERVFGSQQAFLQCCSICFTLSSRQWRPLSTYWSRSMMLWIDAALLRSDAASARAASQERNGVKRQCGHCGEVTLWSIVFPSDQHREFEGVRHCYGYRTYTLYTNTPVSIACPFRDVYVAKQYRPPGLQQTFSSTSFNMIQSSMDLMPRITA